MIFNFYYHKTANFFHFIANLSNWSPRYTTEYARGWLLKTGKLSKDEKKRLEAVAGVLSLHDPVPEWPFLTPDESTVWENAKGTFSSEHLDTIREAFRILEPRFATIWSTEEPKLKQWLRALEKRLDEPKFRELETDLRNFFGSSATEPRLQVCLLISEQGYGGVSLGNRLLGLACSGVPLTEIHGVMATLYHEACHSFYEKPLKYDLISKVTSKLELPNADLFTSKQDLPNTLGEAITSNLLPEGYLAHKYFHSQVPPAPKKGSKADFRNWRLYCAARMFDTTKDYIESKKPLDTGYINRVWETFGDFVKEYPSK